MAARGLRADLHIVLRAGDGDASSEIQSLFRIGVVRDLYRLAGAAVAAQALGHRAEQIFSHHGTLYALDADRNVTPFTASSPD